MSKTIAITFDETDVFAATGRDDIKPEHVQEALNRLDDEIMYQAALIELETLINEIEDKP